MRKYTFLTLLMVVCLLTGCVAEQTSENRQYTVSYLTLFDTQTRITGFAPSEAAFRQTAQSVHDELLRYHQLFDIYHDYEGMNNLKTVNDNAGRAPVAVDAAVIALLKDCVSYEELTGGRMNIGMGSVLALWHEARERGLSDPKSAQLADREALTAASAHCDLDKLLIDEQAGTVFLSDPDMRLDVGAVAKGWAVQQAARHAPKGMLISVGGNICATGPKIEGGKPWVIGVRDPQGTEESYLVTLNLTGGSVVTSGDYQRAYQVDGKWYHHIIDPETLMPGKLWRSVTVICEDSALADALSTALFLMNQQDGQALLDACGARAMWVDAAGQMFYSDGFQEFIRT